MFSFIFSLLVLSLCFGITAGMAFLLRRTVFHGREGMMYPLWIILLIILLIPLRFNLSPLFYPSAELQNNDYRADDYTPTEKIVSENADYENIMPTPKQIEVKTEKPAGTLVKTLTIGAKYVDNAASALFIIWITVASISFGRTLVQYVRANKLMHCTSAPCTDRLTLRKIEEITKRMNIRRPITVRIFEHESLSAPCVSGIFKPVLYLEPGCLELGERKLDCVLTHELTHIRRLDIAGKLLCAFVCAVHWFNPTVYIVRRAMNEDCELSCDYSVIRTYGNDIGALYMGAILDFAKRYSDKCRLICNERYGAGLFISPTSGVQFLKRRYANMKNFKKNRFLTALIAIFSVITLLLNTVTLSSCSDITVKSADVAVDLTPPLDAMMRAYFALGENDLITAEMLDGITSLKVQAETLSDGRILAAFTVNGSNAFTRALPDLMQVNYFENVILPTLFEYGEQFPDEKIGYRFMAYYNLDSLDIPEMTEVERKELLNRVPLLEEYGELYVLDPTSTQRELAKLINFLDKAGLIDGWFLDSSEFDASCFGYFTNLWEVEFVGLTPVGYDFPEDISLIITE